VKAIELKTPARPTATTKNPYSDGDRSLVKTMTFIKPSAAEKTPVRRYSMD
jgi:hypothetical protein